MKDKEIVVSGKRLVRQTAESMYLTDYREKRSVPMKDKEIVVRDKRLLRQIAKSM